jgi:predicted metalloprotease
MSVLRRGVPAILALALAACGVEAGDAAPGIRGVAPTTTTEAATTTTLPAANVGIIGGDDTLLNQVVANAVVDLEVFWSSAYPSAYGGNYRPLVGGVYAIDSGTDPNDIPCASGASLDDILNNAFYCPPEDAMAYDQEQFLPDLAERYGDFTAAVVVAHEWGHVIQQRAQVQAPSVILELQADCFAGAWVGWVEAGDSERFSIDTEQLDQALAGILSLRDAPGSAADDPLAHGSGFDRVGAFQDGFEDGVARCAEYRNGDPEPFQWPFSETELLTEGDLPLGGASRDPGILDLVFPSLDAYWADTFGRLRPGSSWDPLADPVPFPPADPPDCGGEPVEEFVLFVCIPDRYVGFEAVDTIPAAYEQGGDFAVATLFATQYGLDVVDQLGSASDQVTATLQGDCFAGAWAAALLPRDVDGPPEDYLLVLSPGDLDEGVAVLLSFRSDTDRERQGPGFDRVRAYRAGVLRGADACLEVGS